VGGGGVGCVLMGGGWGWSAFLLPYIQLFVKFCHLSLNGTTQYCAHFLECKM